MLSPTTRIIHPRPGSLSHPYTPVALNSPALDRATLSCRKIYYVRTDNITFSLSYTPNRSLKIPRNPRTEEGNSV